MAASTADASARSHAPFKTPAMRIWAALRTRMVNRKHLAVPLQPKRVMIHTQYPATVSLEHCSQKVAAVFVKRKGDNKEIERGFDSIKT